MYDGAKGIGFHSVSTDSCASLPQLCTNLQRWYSMEAIVPHGNNPQGGPQGNLSTYFTYDGVFSGWAVDTSDTSKTLQVNLYDGPIGTGTLLSSMQANGVSHITYPGNHGFTYQVPANLKDKLNHTLYAYIMPAQGNPLPLANSPITFMIYTPTAAGQTYYTNTLHQSLVNGCASCHNGDQFFTYLGLYAVVAENASPEFSGTATNNWVITHAMGGDSHPDGVRCNSNSSPCQELITWFAMDFN
jgi:hypothetical protein